MFVKRYSQDFSSKDFLDLSREPSLGVLGYDQGMKTVLRTMLIGFTALGSIGCLFYLAYASGFFNIDSIEVKAIEGDHLQKNDELEFVRPLVMHVLNAYKGQPIWKAPELALRPDLSMSVLRVNRRVGLGQASTW